MRKYLILNILAAVIFTVAGCKTSESNYREAYEKAIAGREANADLDSTVYGTVRRQMSVREVVLPDGTTVPVYVQHVRVTDGGGGIPENLRRYNVVVGRFKQLFNAKSLRNRLVDDNVFPGAFVVQTAEPYYYIVASSWSSLAEAAAAMRAMPANAPAMKEPLPFILDATRRTAR